MVVLVCTVCVYPSGIFSSRSDATEGVNDDTEGASDVTEGVGVVDDRCDLEVVGMISLPACP